MTDQSLDALREEARETLIVDIKNLLTWAGVGAESDAGEDLLARLNSLLAALPREPRKNADGLLPCPFCGSEPQYYFDGEDHVCGCVNVDCCGGMPGSVGNASKAEAIAKWNTRVSGDPERDSGLRERGQDDR